MSPSVAHVDVSNLKPPAAIAGSPGTTIVSVESLGSSADAFLLPDCPAGSRKHSGRDPIPPLWSFETSYTVLGGMIGTPPRTVHQHHEQQYKKDLKDNGQVQVLYGNWFGRKKEREKEKDQTRQTDQHPHSRSERSKSVDPPFRTLHPVKSSIVGTSSSPSTSTSSGNTLTSRQSTNMRSISISNVSSAPHTRLGQVKADPGPLSSTSSLPESPVKGNARMGARHITSTTPSYPEGSSRPARSRHPPSSFNNAANGLLGESGGEKKRRPTTSGGSTQTASHPSQSQQSFLGDALTLYGTGESHMSTLGSLAPSHQNTPLVASKVVPDSRKETPAESLKRRMKTARARGFTLKNEKRYHPLPRDEAPYTRNYEYQTLDLDEWTRVFELHLAKKCTFFPFTTAPKRVLDLGCGTGSWIMQCAGEWKDTTFVGFDLVSIQPDLKRIGDTSLARRIEWVTGNFLKPLPFKNGEFDFVHVRRIARGVPENRWESLLDEITRVLKDGGAFEMVEEDLFFPGSVLCESKGGSSSDEESAESSCEADVEAKNKKETLTHTPVDDCARIDGDTLVSFWDNEEEGEVLRKGRQTNIPILSERQKSRLSMDERPERSNAPGGSLRGKSVASAPRDSLFHPLINPIMNPRDHSILEAAYNELHASRFINLLPLSLLSSMLVYHFKDVLTHEQTELLFPKKLHKKTGFKKRSLSLHAPLDSLSPPVDPSNTTKPSASRRKSYHAKMSESPGTTNPSTKPPEVFFRPLNMITGGAIRLPNDKWRFDERMLSMHLATRANEILACAEEMWEFIQQCQGDLQRWKNTPMAALSGLVREEWDDCLVRFQLDMQDKIGLGDLLRLELPSGILPSPKKSERKLFDEAVERWETHRRQSNPKGDEKLTLHSKRRRPISSSIRIFIARKEY